MRARGRASWAGWVARRDWKGGGEVVGHPGRLWALVGLELWRSGGKSDGLPGRLGLPQPPMYPSSVPPPPFGLSLGSRTHFARGLPGDSPGKAALRGRSLGCCSFPGLGGPDSGCTSRHGLGRSRRRSTLVHLGRFTRLTWLVFLLDFSPPSTSRCIFLTTTRISIKSQRKDGPLDI